MKRFLLTVCVLALSVSLFGCQATSDWLRKSDSDLAATVFESSNKELCAMSRSRFGPQTTASVDKWIKLRRIQCNEDLGLNRKVETALEKEQRINKAILLLNAAAQMVSPNTNQSIKGSDNAVCFNVSQARSGLYLSCSFRCPSGLVARSYSDTLICPSTVNQ